MVILTKKQQQQYWMFAYWKKNKFKILVGFSVMMILYMYLFHTTGEEGKYSLEYNYIPIDPVITSPRVKRYTSESKGEIECRRVLERIFLRPFPNQRPSFLMNGITGKPLELDCYNHELGIACEYNGAQHYKYTPGMHRNHDAFRTQQYRDEMKQRLCKENNVFLITVPYTISVESIENYLVETLRNGGYSC